MSSPTSVREFLAGTAYKGVLPGGGQHTLDPGSVNTTREWDWKQSEKFIFFQHAMAIIDWDGVKDLVWALQEVPYTRARNEADITVAVEKHILYPVWRILTSRDTEPKGKVDVTPEFRESSLREYELRTSILSESYTTGNIAKAGVRVDKIFSLELTYNPKRIVGPRLRSHGNTKDAIQGPATGIKSVSTFLPFQELWGCLGPDFNEHEDEFDIHKLKGLRTGLISKINMTKIASLALHETPSDSPSNVKCRESIET
ncbi:hypothetical protein CERSUDRAFT_72478 [Gelatoporia subvermispora B]|uniref:Uncharacterized protein n=1 Tax=Ceriporiopsis subvermispora (strain B) TaxID=914234 RepID=M2RKF0_CERS8|nr:hypothetical protein CERSUDRAFT_72478 [Gelatoporia subvermispora B]